MKETNSENMQPERSNKVIITAIIAAVIITISCVGGFIATVILVLDEIPFHHLFSH